MSKNRVGWECPKCGACYAPNVQQCQTCNGVIEAIGKPLPPVKTAPVIHLNMTSDVGSWAKDQIERWMVDQLGRGS